MSEEMKPCPKCENPYGYSLRYELYACPDCGHEWVPEDPNSVDAPSGKGCQWERTQEW